ncbi:hypothetical protein E1B28_004937 [Marasmius oreades]|uniref:Oxidized purine nucleoside triphosphate hydrolase n=1 Tax=Marasmius oreades TaxID=181124 RepID=A0A9P8ADH5_9AGAR|nr:uncharacterized protein E1B28_004937 [Marasmius oreades]KAG7097602.1 hypothetical protein E1B28_004937 [Marasmius oreades]
MSTSNPPGVEGHLEEVSRGGNSAEWLPYSQVKQYTNTFIFRDHEILLGLKKRGFGTGKYNGFGGKVEPGESSLQAATRELEEEAGIRAALELAGVFFFVSDKEDKAFHIDIYRGENFTGLITETDEMRPQWFSFREAHIQTPEQLPPIPFHQMWETDPYWIPLLVNRQPFAGRADFRTQGGKLLPSKWWFGTVLP